MSFTEQEIHEIHNAIQPFDDDTEIAVAKIQSDQVAFYGARNESGTPHAVENFTSVFEIGSITKVLTCHLLAKSVLNGEIALDEAINHHIAVPFRNKLSITFKELASHTSGLPRLPPGLIWGALFKNAKNPYRDYLEPQLLSYLEHKLKLKGKGKSVYSNLGMGLLGYTLGQHSNRTYEDLLQESIFKPLDMHNSTSQLSLVQSRLVQGLNSAGKPTPNWDLGVLAGAGAVLSTVEDFSKYILWCLKEDNAIFKLQRQPVSTEHGARIGLGWVILGEPDEKERYYFHNGGTGGYSSCMMIDIQEKTGYVALSNITGLQKRKGPVLDRLVDTLIKGHPDS
ncbi:serine hydrolase domain-containing protein [Vibrio nigripulchritudo]|uniref:serine hydrolase domain-containing protein n=1 Tax=Vibrio nigripulchritudo TaxID=28173 RepID=UPI0024937A94|nr:serine hydrolase domain-containing protein [Vibrio nigripulchritudo]BDU37014.1 hypothetical protein TUMSATVNIG2_14830 [Vibrio nigripulchritudo]BDU42724.1 hypothetical protein TUMSATVNIG3_15220 [Vibrio nigripulchritudo]